MKKLLTRLLILTVLVSAMTISAAAASYEGSAEILNTLGLFQGTENGYDLDAEPTRVQAGVMLVRLMGREEAALAGEYTHPFTDVPAWADKYVGYLFENGLTNGVSDTEFGAADPCDVKMYTTFVLRAIGYDDARGDFSYADAVSFGEQLGIVDPILAEGPFLRDQMAAISYLSLKVRLNEKGADMLLGQLVADGAVSAEAAAPVLDRFSLYEEYAVAARHESLKKMDVDIDLQATLDMLGQAIEMDGGMNVKAILDETLQFALTGEMTTMGEAVELEMYLKDGSIYMNSAGQKMKMDAGMDMDAILEMSGSGYGASELLYIDSIEKGAEDGYTVFTLTYAADTLDSVIASLLAGPMFNTEELAGAGLGAVSLSIPTCAMKMYVDENGLLSAYEIDMSLAMSVSAEGSTMAMSCTLVMRMDVLATGDAVVITYPEDLDSYLSMEELLAGAAQASPDLS